MESSNNNWRLRAWIHTSYIANITSLLAATHKMRISQTPFKWCLEIGDPLEWRLRAWIHTSYIANMNSLLAATHKMRISQTPFKWCLEIGDPLEVNLKLLKKMVRRWVPHHQSFRVSQHLVPFNVQDVFITLGLGVGGLEVPFDESVVGKVGESFNSKCTKLKDLIHMFNVLVGMIRVAPTLCFDDWMKELGVDAVIREWNMIRVAPTLCFDDWMKELVRLLVQNEIVVILIDYESLVIDYNTVSLSQVSMPGTLKLVTPSFPLPNALWFTKPCTMTKTVTCLTT
ncbi:hypothetical protein LR48_Vigan05g111100 [Vigna angularis]|uniref:Aminotransferase-like plant mobile domain-containing protein n=1 Tax=Phaseolus angularis TaxID=3914 RepID=A0A0L9ULT7_PHAAN|nr:hypothetical protein LR48_Vigan05g111100 [Vigna angularis]